MTSSNFYCEHLGEIFEFYIEMGPKTKHGLEGTESFPGAMFQLTTHVNSFESASGLLSCKWSATMRSLGRDENAKVIFSYFFDIIIKISYYEYIE